jgi:nicotinamidase-related amidase
MNIHREDTAVVFIDPQNEVLSEKGSAWPLLHESLAENRTIENMERIFKAAKALSYEEANMCVESHLRELLEQGFEVAVVKDATAGPKHPE